MPEHKHHLAHHVVIGERIAAYRCPHPNQVVARDKAKRAVWTLSDHLRCCHGWRHAVGTIPDLDELERIHDKYHGSER